MAIDFDLGRWVKAHAGAIPLRGLALRSVSDY